MITSILKRTGISFLLGIVIMNLIAYLISSGSGNADFLTVEFVQRIGNQHIAMLLQVLLTGVYGIFSIGGMSLYDIEHWSMLKSALVHYLLCMVSYTFISLFLGWFVPGMALLIMLGIMTVMYLLIWSMCYLSYRSQIRQINIALQVRQTKSC